VVATAPTEEWAAVVARLVDEAERETQLGRTHWLQAYEDVSNASNGGDRPEEEGAGGKREEGRGMRFS
jgi:hypothetical protein